MVKSEISSHRTRLLELIKARGMVRARDLKAQGIPPSYLTRLVHSGELARLGRGLYQEAIRVGEHEHHSLAEAARAVPHGVISLISALQFHGLTTQLPSSVWMTIPQGARTPKLVDLSLTVVRASGPVFDSGIATAHIEGVDVPIYCAAKTVADCFKHRRRVGEDVAIEALRDAISQRKTTAEELMRYAQIDRVAPIVHQLLKALQ